MRFIFTIAFLVSTNLFLNAQVSQNCSQATPITSFPITLSGGFPAFYSFVPPSTGTIDLSSCEFDGHPIVNVYDDCITTPPISPFNEITMTASSTCGQGCNPQETNTFPVSAGDIVYISVQIGTCGDPVNFGFNPSNACDNAEVLDCNSIAQGFIGTSTPSFFNRTDYENGCASFLNDNELYNGGDRLYEFSLPVDDTVTISLTNFDESGDFDMFLMQGLCDETSPTCVRVDTNGFVGDEVITTFLEAGTYHIIVDDYEGSQAGGFSLELECPAIACDCGPGTIICDNFERYQTGPLTPQSSDWQLWNAAAADAVVIDSMSNGAKALLIQRDTIDGQVIDPDVVLQLGEEYDAGTYQISWNMYVEPGRTGYYNIQHTAGLSHWAYEVFFDVGGTGRIEFGTESLNRVEETFEYPVGQWFEVYQTINLEADQITLAINGQMLKNFPFSIGTSNGNENNARVLAAVNFYAREDAKYYIDDICFSEFNCNIITLFDPVCANGIEYFNSGLAACYGISQFDVGSCNRCDYFMDLCCDDSMTGNTACEIDDFNNNQAGGLGFCGPFLEEENSQGDTRNGELPYTGRDKLFRINITEPSTTILIDATFSSQRMDLFLLEDCGEEACYLARGFFGEVGNNQQIQYTFETTGFFYILIDGWTADDFGNYSISTSWSCTQNLQVFCPSDRTISCGESEHPDNTGYPDPAGDLGNEEISFIDAIALEGCDTVITRTWTVSNRCETASCQQTIVKRDFEPPIVICPTSIVVECSESIDPQDVGFPNAMDECDHGVNFDYADNNFYDYGFCENFISRQWIVSDNCGNINSSCIQDISIIDNSPPIINCPPDVTVDCTESFSEINTTGEATAIDVCLGEETSVGVLFTDSIANNNCPIIIHRIWRATDDCGNLATCPQIITYEDNTPPVLFGAPEDLTVECDNIPSIPGLEYTDDCNETVQAFIENTIVGNCEGNFSIERIWTLEDACGNQTIHTQIITVVDTTPPQISCPESITVDCGESTAPENTGTVIASDNCDFEPNTIFEDQNPNENCLESGGIMRTWTATDDCGNTNSCTQQILINDNEAPSFDSCPENISAECGELPPPPTLTATDNCDTDVTISLEETIDGDSCNLSVTRIWTATDDCGNTTGSDRFCIQQITIVDNEVPVLSNCPENITAECGELPPPSTPTATDNCDTDVTISLEETIDGDSCNLSVTRIWTATDDCGNTTGSEQFCIQQITIIDNEAPVLSNCPENISVECDQIPEVPNLTATDNCTEDIEVEFSEDFSAEEACPNGGTLFRNWTATDNCGNLSSCFQEITVFDNTAPELSRCPESVTVECDQVPNAPILTATDNCTGEIQVVFSQDFNNDEICPEGGILFRNWSITDDCGNANSCLQQITIIDSTPPLLDGCPENITVECDQIPNAPTVTATDNCTEGIEVEFSEDFSFDDACPTGGTLFRAWSATDNCGNTSSCLQEISVTDNIPPSIVCPENSSIEVTDSSNPNENTSLGFAIGNDNCSEEVIIAFTDNEAGLTGCNGTGILSRTWTSTDNCGNATSCEQQITIEDNNPIALTVENVVDASCGEANGQITVAIANSEGQVQYSINDGPFSDSNVFSNLTGDQSYIIIARDDSGCDDMLSQFIEQTPSISIEDINVQDDNCSEMLGSISIEVASETGGVIYTLNGGTPQSNNVFSGLSQGSYMLVVEDGNGCQDSMSNIFIDNFPPARISSVEVLSQSTCGVPTGSLQINAIDVSETGLEYSIDGGESFQLSNVFNELTAGDYMVVVRTQTGCLTSFEEAVAIEDQGGPEIEEVAIVADSCGNQTGEIIVQAGGGTGNLEYALEEITDFQASNTFTGLAGGTYTVIVRDSNNCQITDMPTISTLEPPTIAGFDLTTASCEEPNGSIQVIAAEGMSPYQYAIDGSDFQNNDTFEGLLGNESYSFSIRDANGCLAMSSTDLDNLASPVIDEDNISTTPDTCGLRGGQIIVPVFSGTGNYSFFLDGTIQNDSIFENIAAGVHQIIVADENCQDTANLSLALLDVPTVVATNIQSDTCDLNNGSIQIEAEGNTDLTFTLDEITSDVGFFDGLDAANYSITIADDFGCQIDTTVAVIDDGSMVEVNIQTLETSGNVSDDGTICATDAITLTAVGMMGTDPYTYIWSNGFEGPSQTLNLIENTNFTVSVTDAIRCMGEQMATISVLAPPEVEAQTNAGVCEGDDLELFAISQNDITNYQWQGPNDFNSTQQNPLIASADSSSVGLYSVIATDANNCQARDTVDAVVISPALFPALASISPQFLCENEEDNAVQLLGFNYPQINTSGMWFSSDIMEVLEGDTITLENLPYGESTFSYALGTEACDLGETSLSVWFEQPPIANNDTFITRENVPIENFDILANDNVFINGRQNLMEYEIQNISERDIDEDIGVDIKINADNTLSISMSETFFGEFSFTYELYSTLCDERSTARVTIIVEEQKEKEICVFDLQQNGIWIPCFPIPDNNEMIIMNRYGKVVFIAKNYSPDNGWDGSLPAEDASNIPADKILAPTGTYYFILKSVKETDIGDTIMGSVLVLR